MGLSLGAWYPFKAAGLFAIVMLAARSLRRTDHPFPRFGPANQITTLRAALVALVAGLIGEAALPFHAAVATAISVVVAILDGVDGWLARRSRMASRFGARFDMEIDALLIMVLAVLAWYYGKAGAWVILSGLLRYLFVVAGWIRPWMQQPLPYRRRRQTICVVQIVGLILTIAPFVEPSWSVLTAGASLLALGCSFLVDILWLRRHAAPARQAA